MLPATTTIQRPASASATTASGSPAASDRSTPPYSAATIATSSQAKRCDPAANAYGARHT